MANPFSGRTVPADVLQRMPVLFLLALMTPARAAGQDPAGIDRVAWLQGCWEAVSETGSVEEQWTAPRGGSMVGLSRTVRENRLAAYELIVIRENGQQLVYQAHPSGQASATFLSRVIASDSVVFENPQHDFPQRIGYRRDGDRLTAWIEGNRDGQRRRSRFPYQRAACAGG